MVVLRGITFHQAARGGVVDAAAIEGFLHPGLGPVLTGSGLPELAAQASPV
jgi:hypothetical protein